MDGLLLLLLLMVLLVVLLGPIGALLVFLSTRRRLDEATGRLSELEAEVARLQRAGAYGAPAAATVEKGIDEPTVDRAPTPPAQAVATPETARPDTAAPDTAAPDTAAPSTPTAARTDPPRPKIKIEWERWIGVRGAAVLGGVVLALAGVLFLKYSIEHDLIPPIVRVALGVAVGALTLIGSEILRKRGYVTVANSLAGASVVLFYSSVWAARALYDLIPGPVAWALMVLVTLVCGLLSWRRNSLLVAVLGLVGGFSTPLLLSTGENRPLGLFAYILLLDLGLIVLARKRGWPALGVLSLVGTALYQVLWIGLRMESDQLILALAILGVFAVLFAVARRGAAPGESKGAWAATQGAGVLLPFAFAFELAARAEFLDQFLPIAALLILLSLLALALSRAFELPILARCAALADVAILAVWASRVQFDDRAAWQAAGVAVAFALTFQLFQHFTRRRRGLAAAADEWGALIATAGPFAVLVWASVGTTTALWPWLAGWTALAGLLVWSGGYELTSQLQVVAAAALSIGLILFRSGSSGNALFPSSELFLGLAFASAVGFQAVALRRRGGASGRNAEVAAAASAMLLLAGILLHPNGPAFDPLLFFGYTLGLGLLLALCSTRLPSGKLLLATMAVVAFMHLAWVEAAHAGRPGGAVVGLVGGAAGVLLFTAWPFIVGGALARDRWALYASALAAPAWFFPLVTLWETHWGTAAIGALPIALGIVSLVAAVRARGRWPVDDPRHKQSLVWFLAVALGFVSLAIPLQLDREWITIGWALEGLALLALWRRLDHPGLKYFGLGLLAAVSVRLVGNPEVLDYHGRARFPVTNWLMYTYLVPAAALLGSARMLEQLEVVRRRDWEEGVYSRGKAWGAMLCALAAILVVFVWINLTIFDFFSTGSEIQLSLDRHMARDLTLSIAWALFALGLLAIGMARKSSGLRWISLCFLIMTIGKAFLYDLGELEDLYRVASLAGLAISLIAVSLAYQRFVFGADRMAGTTGSTPAEDREDA